MSRQMVRLRTEDGWLCSGYSFDDNTWDWRPDLGQLYSSSGVIPGLGDDDCQDNYWVVETEAGRRYAFQSIDVEDGGEL